MDKIIETLLSWRVSTFNAKSLPIPWEWREKIDAWIAKMGYHFVIDEAEMPAQATRGEDLPIRVCIDNVGVAPIYKRLPLYIRLKNTERTQTFETDVDIREWIDGKYEENMVLSLPTDMLVGEYEVQVGIGGDGAPSVVFATDAKQDGAYSVLGRIKIQ